LIIGLKNKHNFSWELIDILENIGIILVLIGVFSEIICVAGIIMNRLGYDIDYQNALYEREVLEYRLDHREDDFPGNEMLYSDIVKFNNKLRDQKKWANNPWTNWFNNEKIAALDYIELGSE
jgi:hypothetical protein